MGRLGSDGRRSAVWSGPSKPSFTNSCSFIGSLMPWLWNEFTSGILKWFLVILIEIEMNLDSCERSGDFENDVEIPLGSAGEI